MDKFKVSIDDLGYDQKSRRYCAKVDQGKIILHESYSGTKAEAFSKIAEFFAGLSKAGK